jgi:hypothetical protein
MLTVVLPSMSALEAIRLVLAVVGLCAAGWGLAHATNGMAAFAMPIRARMVTRRRWQMAGALGMFAVLASQTALAAATPEARPPSLPTVTVSVAIICVLVERLAITLHQALGWVGFEEVLGQKPLVLTADETVTETSAVGREISHAINNDLALLLGALHELNNDAAMLPGQRAVIARAEDYVLSVAEGHRELHQLFRSLRSSTPSPEPQP